MKVSVFGLGYVGCVTAACLTKSGHEVWGVDVKNEKVDLINAGQSPIHEKGLSGLIAEGREAGRLRATTDPVEAVVQTEVSIVCVGTPSSENGSLSMDAMEAVSRQIGKGIRKRGRFHTVVFRSTILPGTTRRRLIPLLENASGKAAHEGFHVFFNPEFLREGSSIHDFYHPPFTIIGSEEGQDIGEIKRLYDGIEAPIKQVRYEAAEMVKYSCNIFHALKVSFANEIGVLCRSLEIDSHQVMDLFCLDTKLNISKAYLKPGFAFGGSCLPKDLRAMLYEAKAHDLVLPMLSSLFESNRLHVERTLQKILATKKKKVGILGLSFKLGTDDLRESPMVSLIETLLGKGLTVRIYDSDVRLGTLMGANKSFIEREIPHIASLISDQVEGVIESSDIVVIGKKEPDIDKALIPYLREKRVFDLVRVFPEISSLPENYTGICW